MSMPIVQHVRQKSQTKGSARTFCFDLAIYANDCCGVAWPSDAKLYQGANVSRQRIHELKHKVMDKGELIIFSRPGTTNLYFLAAYGQPLGPQGEYLTTKQGRHEPDCPWQRPVSDLSDPSLSEWVSGISDPQVSDWPDPPCQGSLTQQQKTTREKNTGETFSLLGEIAADAVEASHTTVPEVSPPTGQGIRLTPGSAAYRLLYGDVPTPHGGYTASRRGYEGGCGCPLRDPGIYD